MPRPLRSPPAEPPVWYQPGADADGSRFASMSVTRNPTGALIPNDRKELQPRVSASESLEPPRRVRVTRAPPGPEFDVAGSHPRPLHVGSLNRHNPLDVTDIPGSQTRTGATGLVTGRTVDPLSPAYAFPGASLPPKPVDVPPFKRDLCRSVDDIPGAKPTPLYADRTERPAAPVPRATSSIRTRRGPFPDVLDVTDINREGKFVSSRATDPLAPSYTHHGATIADEPGAHFVPKYHQRKAGAPSASASDAGVPAPFLSLTTSDIAGARTGESAEARVGSVPIEGRRAFARTNFLGDIPGAQAGSHRSGLPERSVVTDPNSRDYLLLDGARAADVYAATGVGLSAYGLEAAEVAALGAKGGGPVDPPPSVRRRVRVDPRDAEIVTLRRQVEELSRAARAPAEGDPFVAIAAKAEGVAAPSPRLSQAVGHAHAKASDAAPPAAGSARATAAAVATSADSARGASAATAPLPSRSQSNQSAPSDPESAPPPPLASTAAAPADLKSPRRAPGGGGAVRQAAVASVAAIATGHAASSSAAPVKFSDMSKAMVLAKKGSGAAGGATLSSGGALGASSYAGGLSSRIMSMTRAAEIAAVRGLPG